MHWFNLPLPIWLAVACIAMAVALGALSVAASHLQRVRQLRHVAMEAKRLNDEYKRRLTAMHTRASGLAPDEMTDGDVDILDDSDIIDDEAGAGHTPLADAA